MPSSLRFGLPRIGLAVIVLAALYVIYSLLQPSSLRAATSAILVTTTVDESFDNGQCSLRSAILAANRDARVAGCQAGTGADIIVLPSGVYSLTLAGAYENAGLTGDLDIAGDLTITGETSATTIIDAAHLDRALDIRGGRVVLRDLTVRNGRIATTPAMPPNESEGAGILMGSSGPAESLELHSVTVADNRHSGSEWTEGGGIVAYSALTITDSLISGNAALYGGGIFSWRSLRLENSVCRDNAGTVGGCLAGNRSIVIAGSLIHNNAPYQDGPATIPSGGGISIGLVGDVHISGSTISANAKGSGIVNDGTAWITDTLVTRNAGNSGGGIVNRGWLSLSASAVSENQAYTALYPGEGGGIANEGELIVSTSVISGNSAPHTGGLLSSGSASISATSIINNVSLYGRGGGVANAGRLSLSNVTVSGNQAQGHGGGLANSGAAASMRVSNSTITGNLTDRADAPTYPGDGGGVYASGPITVSNTIIAGNADRTGQAPDAAGTLISGGHNLIGSTTGATISGDTAGNLLNQAALLAPLADNGGAAPTHALLPDSPAIDAASPLAPGSSAAACAPADQRGVTRPQDGDGDGTARCDIGAVEVGVIEVDTAADDTSANGNCTLREAVRAANLDMAVDGCAAGSGADTILLPSGVYAYTQLGVSEDAGLTGDLDIAGDLTISGALSATTVIDAAGIDRVLDIHSGRVALRNLSVRRGRINGALLPTNQFWGGAGILVRSAAPTSSLELHSSAVSDNRAQASEEWTRGGGIFSAAPITVTASLISANAASQGGGVYAADGLVFDRSVARENQAKAGAGISSQEALSVTDSLIHNNAFFQAGPFSQASGSGIFSSGDIHISGSLVSMNRPGGGMQLRGQAAITNTLIVSNTADRGAGITNLGRLSLVGSTVSHNVATQGDWVGGGGGILNQGELIVATSVISANVSDQAGGLLNYDQATISASTIANNVALGGTDRSEQLFGDGGGVYNTGQITLTNVTVSGNSAQLSGGGLASAGANARMTLLNSTVTDNLADRTADALFNGGDAGGVYAGSPVSITNTIIAGNATRTGQRPDAGGVLLSGGHNLIGSTSGVTLTGDTAGNLLNVAALLGPLAANGGATPTHALLPDSPAIDAASPLAPGSGGGACAPADQRGVARPLDGDGDGIARCDIGAFEAPAVPVPPRLVYLPSVTR